MKFKVAKKVMADRERALLRISDIEADRKALDIEFAPIAQDDERVKAMRANAETARNERDALKQRHEDEMTAANARVYETAFAADQLAANFEEKNKNLLTKRAALDSRERAVRADLAKIEKLVPEAEARFAKQREKNAPCEECDGAKVVAAFCDDPKHDQEKPGVQSAGEQHECRLKIIPCPKCSAPKVVKLGTGRINPKLFVQGGSTPRHPHNMIPKRTRGTPIEKAKINVTGHGSA